MHEVMARLGIYICIRKLGLLVATHVKEVVQI